VTVLLVLSLAYAALRRSRCRPRHLVATAAAITAGSLMVRLASPFAAESFSNLRWAAWPQAAGLFTLGVLAGQEG
jgi:hypothetical protein